MDGPGRLSSSTQAERPRKSERSHKTGPKKLTPQEIATLREVFRLLQQLRVTVGESRLFSDQTHSYTAVTSILRASLIKKYGAASLKAKLVAFAKLLDKDGAKAPSVIATKLKQYREHSARQTTHVSRRTARDKLFVDIIHAL